MENYILRGLTCPYSLKLHILGPHYNERFRKELNCSSGALSNEQTIERANSVAKNTVIMNRKVAAASEKSLSSLMQILMKHNFKNFHGQELHPTRPTENDFEDTYETDCNEKEVKSIYDIINTKITYAIGISSEPTDVIQFTGVGNFPELKNIQDMLRASAMSRLGIPASKDEPKLYIKTKTATGTTHEDPGSMYEWNKDKIVMDFQELAQLAKLYEI